jgi:hypothetical protein
MLSARSAHIGCKTLKAPEKLGDTVLGLSAKFVLANMMVKHLSESLRKLGRRVRERL